MENSFLISKEFNELVLFSRSYFSKIILEKLEKDVKHELILLKIKNSEYKKVLIFTDNKFFEILKSGENNKSFLNKSNIIGDGWDWIMSQFNLKYYLISLCSLKQV
ncbi:hypothetical protein HZS_791 [Henneguya salminicola]|nr:hypothetical protein HZS_791 [Henneguya salminicola]